MSDKHLQSQVLDAIASGRLPSKIPKRSWGGVGTGCMCSVCGTPINREQFETEIEDHGKSFHLHITCMAAWQSLIALGDDTGPDPSLQPVGDGRYSAAGEQPPETAPDR